jgi:fatty acid desaturase
MGTSPALTDRDSYSDSQILAQQRRASKEVTVGLEKEINDLHKLDHLKRLGEVGFFLSLYFVGAGMSYWLGGSLFWYVATLLLMGLAFNSLPIFLHEGLHGLLANNKRANHLFSFLVSLPLMMSSTAYEVTHTNHHIYLGRKSDYGTYKQYVKKPILVWVAYFSQLIAGSFLYLIFIPILGFKSASNTYRVFIIIEYIAIACAFYVFFTTFSVGVILQYWFYPILVMTVLTNIRGLASHALSDVENIYLSSRTIESSKLTAFLFMNENLHLEHHLFPSMPSYNLGKTHELIWDRLPEALYAKSYLQFLYQMVKAAVKNDLDPQGVVIPSKQ